MARDMKKSFGAPNPSQMTTRAFITTRHPGQVPDKERMAAMKLATAKAPKFHANMMLNHDSPMMSTGSVVDGLGFEPSERMMWKAFLDEVMQQPNEVVVRKALISKMLGDHTEPALRRALFQRSLNLYRNRFQKSMTEVIDPNELQKSGPFYGPKNGKYADAALTIPWDEKKHKVFNGKTKAEWKDRASYHEREVQNIKKKLKENSMTGQIFKKYDNPKLDSLRQGLERHRVAMHAAMDFSDPTKEDIDYAISKLDKSLPPEFDITGEEFDAIFSPRDSYTKFYITKYKSADPKIENRIENLCARKGISRAEFDRRVKARASRNPEPMQKGEPRGGSYYRRTTTKSGKHRYFYKPEDYDKSKDAHVDGEATADKRITEHVTNGVKESGKKGYNVKEMKALVKRYGSKRVGDSLKKQCAEGGSLKYKGGKFYASEKPKEKDDE